VSRFIQELQHGQWLILSATLFASALKPASRLLGRGEDRGGQLKGLSREALSKAQEAKTLHLHKNGPTAKLSGCNKIPADQSHALMSNPSTFSTTDQQLVAQMLGETPRPLGKSCSARSG
jgi:hypothetical protein